MSCHSIVGGDSSFAVKNQTTTYDINYIASTHVDPEAIEIFINSDKDNFAELCYKKQITPLESRKGCKLNGVIFIPNVYTVSYSENPARIFYGAEKGT